jgi:hypothetical protein
VPESRSSSRNSYGASVSPSSADGGGGGATRAELRLRVLRSLPPAHIGYLNEEIRKLCRGYLRNRRVLVSEMTPDELLSEIYQKLLGTASLRIEEAPNSTEWSIDPHVPERDGRVVWLIEEIGGTEAIAHLYEDILRQRHGRSAQGRGRRLVQPGNEDEPFEIGSDPVECGTLQEVDARRAWRGLLVTAELEFQRDEDASMLLRLMADVPGIFEDSSGGQWPVQDIVELLNGRFPPPSWSGDRVDNAKRRLINWINRLMRKNGLDATDLEGLFARVGRQQEGERTLLTQTPHPNLPS